MITVLETYCYPKAFTLTEDGKTPISNGDWSMWFQFRAQAQAKANEMNKERSPSMAFSVAKLVEAQRKYIVALEELLQLSEEQIKAQDTLINILLA